VIELPESALPRCLVCGEPVPTMRGRVLYEVHGYERPRAGGGANHIIARRLTGRVVGECCADRVQSGRVNQETLV
jgi:hypothetical protein